MSKYKDIISELIVTCFFIGKIKYAPGTFGSLLAFPISYFIVFIILKSRFLLPIAGFSEAEREFVTITTSLLFAVAILSIIGVIASNYYMEKRKEHDPKEIVIDEVVGQMLTITLTSLSVAFVHYSNISDKYNAATIDWICFFVLPFILFRACDIIKPWPIKWMDQKIKGGVGVVVDDIAAGFLAAVLQYAIIFAVVGKA